MARTIRVVEASKKLVKLRILVPPDSEKAVQFAGSAVGADLVDRVVPPAVSLA